MTFAEKFIRDNVLIENDRNGNPRRMFILCRNAEKIDLDNPTRLLIPGVVHKFKCDTDSKIISFEARVRFKNAILKAEDNVPRIFIFLNQLLTEDAIQRYFKEVWIRHNNLKVRKHNTHEFQMFAHALKRGKIKIDPLHRDCVQATANRSIRQAAKEYRNFFN